MPTPELFVYFPHDLPVLRAKFYDESIITLTQSTLRFWTRLDDPESEFMPYKHRLDSDALDMAIDGSFVYVLDTAGVVSQYAIDSA